MFPLIELRGAIPFATALGVDIFLAYFICIIGNMIPVFFIFPFAKKILYWGKDKKYIGRFFSFCIKKGFSAGKKLENKVGIKLYIALALFVGIPLPGTGAWTGSLAASLLGLDTKKSIISILIGILISGILMLIISFGIFFMVTK